jgi:hypothetical protein
MATAVRANKQSWCPAERNATRAARKYREALTSGI